MIPKMHKSWNPMMSSLTAEPLQSFLRETLPTISYQPNQENIFKIFERNKDEIKVVILGEEPSCLPNESVGYSYINTQQVTPELKGIVEHPNYTNIETWAEQGVFLLNTALTVETFKPNSHTEIWSDFIKRVIAFLSITNPCIWLLWGKNANMHAPYIRQHPIHVSKYDETTIEDIPANPDWNYIFTDLGPSDPNFVKCKHFERVNILLNKLHKGIINF